MKLAQLVKFGAQVSRINMQKSYRIPLSIHLVLTNRCNLKCTYCRTHDLPQKDVWTTEALKGVIGQMAACGTERIHFTGGEPTLRDDLGEIINYAKNLGVFVTFVTNGTNIPQRINDIKNVDVVFLSYDGVPEAHGQIRGEKNVEQIELALNALKEAGIKTWITVVLTKLNAHRLDEIINFVKTHNIKANFTRLEFFKEEPYHLHPMLKDVDNLTLRGEERIKVFKKLIQLKKKGAPIASTFEYLKNGMEWPYDDIIYDSAPSKRYTCMAGRAYGHLEANGMLYSCGTGVTRVEGQSVFQKGGFQSAWEKVDLIHNCNSCSHACGVESNLIFSLNPNSILNHLQNLNAN